jgi:hypothetical protein
VKSEVTEEHFLPKGDDDPALLVTSRTAPSGSSLSAGEPLRSEPPPSKPFSFGPEAVSSFESVHNNPIDEQATKDQAPKSLWNEAYNALQAKDQKLVDSNVQNLLSSQDTHRQGTLWRSGCSGSCEIVVASLFVDTLRIRLINLCRFAC